MTSGLDEPGGLGWQSADSGSSYSIRGSAMTASAFAITASARFIAARSSSLCHVSAEWPSSNDRSWTSCARETSSLSAAMASESSPASAAFREDCVTSISLSHRKDEPSGEASASAASAFAMSDIRPLVPGTIQHVGEPLLRQFLIFHAAVETDIFVVWAVRPKLILLSAQLAFAEEVRDITAVYDTCVPTTFEQLWLMSFSDHWIASILFRRCRPYGPSRPLVPLGWAFRAIFG
ncbi:hypothetical protein ACVWW3_000562 [Bradyrhizobium sp. LM2.9]